jgi:hypothetical protein
MWCEKIDNPLSLRHSMDKFSFQCFCDDRVRFSRRAGVHCLVDAWNIYRDWQRENPDKRRLSQKKFRNYIERIFPNCFNNQSFFIHFFRTNEECEDYENALEKLIELRNDIRDLIGRNP